MPYMISKALRYSSGLGPKTGPGIFQLGQPSQIIWPTLLLLIRPRPDIDMSEGLKLYCCNFSTRLLSYTSTPRSGRPSKFNVYHRFGCRVYSILQLSILATLPLIFTRGGQKVWFWPRSSTPLFFEPPSFRNEATHSYQSILFGAAMMELFSPQTWCSLAHRLWWVEFENPSTWKIG